MGYGEMMGRQFIVQPPQPLDCERFCPGDKRGCPLGPFVIAEVTGIQVSPEHNLLISPIGLVCMEGQTEPPEQSIEAP